MRNAITISRNMFSSAGSAESELVIGARETDYRGSNVLCLNGKN